MGSTCRALAPAVEIVTRAQTVQHLQLVQLAKDIQEQRLLLQLVHDCKSFPRHAGNR